MTAPIAYTWDGEAMKPLPRFQKLCDRQFVVGMIYPLIQHEQRSANSHRHFFAAITEAWQNLPDDLAIEFTSPEHLRKWALVQAGYADERSIACASKLEARKIAAFIKPMDEYAVVTVRDDVIKVYTAQSQSMRAMGKKDFQASKDAVLDVCARLIGLDVAALSAHVKSAPSIAPTERRAITDQRRPLAPVSGEGSGA